MLDCLIIGGGPAGLVAAVYLARFRRKALLVDVGEPRAFLIPLSHNCPGFPDGIGGRDLIARQRSHAEHSGAVIQRGMVTGLHSLQSGTFAATYDDADGREVTVEARTVILASGVLDALPKMTELEEALAAGRLRHCPVCDGFEVIDRKVAVIGAGAGGLSEALFLRTYSADITLFSLDSAMEVKGEDRKALAEAGITAVETPVNEVLLENDAIALRTGDGRVFRFDTLYSALGGTARSKLAVALGAEFGDCLGLVTGPHQQTNISGLYAIGDVVDALNQIAVAWGHAAIAATAIHNRLKD